MINLVKLYLKTKEFQQTIKSFLEYLQLNTLQYCPKKNKTMDHNTYSIIYKHN